MQLEAAVFSQDQLVMKKLRNLGGTAWNLDSACTSMAARSDEYLSPPEERGNAGRRKRQRAKIMKNQEEVEIQRITHIAVERNRRKQMNEFLAVLRSLMPACYVQRGDQASIIGGAINFVKELEHLVQSLEARKRTPFTDFFTFPQYSTTSPSRSTNSIHNAGAGDGDDVAGEAQGRRRPAVADIEVSMVESHANLKVLSRRQPKQLLKMVVGLQNLGLTILHVNVTTVADMAFCSFSLKVDDDCQLISVDDIATAVHELVCTIQEEQESATFYINPCTLIHPDCN